MIFRILIEYPGWLNTWASDSWPHCRNAWRKTYDHNIADHWLLYGRFDMAGNFNWSRHCRFSHNGICLWSHVSNCHILFASNFTKALACDRCRLSCCVSACEPFKLLNEGFNLRLMNCRFAQGGVAFFPFINGQLIDKAGITSMLPYTLGLGIATTIIWILVPSPVPMFGFLSKSQKEHSEDVRPLPVDQEGSTTA